MNISQYMSWEDGVDLVAVCNDAQQPNIIVHVARNVNTPVGSAPAGMILLQPDPGADPVLVGFVSPKEEIANYFGPHIFKGTPFETAPSLVGSIEIETGSGEVTSRILIGEHRIECTLSGLAGLEHADRPPGQPLPFHQSVIEATAGQAQLIVNGQNLEIALPPIGISGGAPAVYAPCGIYSR